MSETVVKAWVCPVCGYVHYGAEPPDECPVCGAPKSDFEPAPEAGASGAPAAGPSGKALIVGAGIAGVSAAEALRQVAPQAEITLISSDAALPYYRLNLTRYLAGEVSGEQLVLHPEDWYAERRIELLRSSEARQLDLAQKQLALADGRRLAYDQLILTVGARPFLPPFPGAHRKNVTALRTRQEADFILQACQGGRACVCIGGGLLGLETAGALACRGIPVTVLENQAWLLPRQLNQAAGRLFQERVRALGIALRTRALTRELEGDEAVRGVLLEDGERLPAEVVVISAGVRANLDLARQAGLEVKQGLLVDNWLRTSQSEVYAAGDVAEHRGVLYGTWAPAQMQGSIAGMNAGGQKVEFNGIARATTLKVLGINLFSIGKIAPESAADVCVEAELDGNYYCFVLREGLLAGAILLGDTSLAAKVKKVVDERSDCSCLVQGRCEVKDVLEFLQGVG